MNTPNKITISRICLIPLIVFFYLATFIEFGKIIALAIFIIASLTDFLDGYLARKNNQVTDLGKFLDPIADKILVLTGLALIMADGAFANPYAAITLIIIVSREFIVSALRQLAATNGVVIQADKLGKSKTFCTFIAISMFMLLGQNLTSQFITGTFLSVVEGISYALMGVSVALTIVSGINYVVRNRSVFKTK